MICPKCKADLWCNCERCNPYKAKSKKTVFVAKPNAVLECGNCGYTEHIDQWEEREVNEIYNQKIKMKVKP